MLKASRATVELLIRHGTSDLSIKDMAANAGISERTFYRYFPRKEDVVRPFFQSGLCRIVANFNARPKDESILDSLRAVWSDAWPLKDPDASAAFYRILESHDSYRAVRLQVVIDSEIWWAEAIALRLGIEPLSRQATFAGAAVITAFRMAWQAFSLDRRLDPIETLMANFQIFSETLLTSPEVTVRTSGAATGY
jgi:AcrR family transcriptional regulator